MLTRTFARSLHRTAPRQARGLATGPVKELGGWFSNIPVESKPLIYAVAAGLGFGAYALLRHTEKDVDLRLKPHDQAFVEKDDPELQKALSGKSDKPPTRKE